MLGKISQLLNDSGEVLYILGEGRGKTFEFQHGGEAGFALIGKAFTLASLLAK